MAFNWQTFRTRSLTAAIFVVIMLAGLLWNRWSFFALFSVIHFGAWVEYGKLVGRFNTGFNRISFLHRYGMMFGGWCLMLFFTNYELRIGELNLTDIGFWCGLTMAILLPVIMFLEPRQLFLGNLGYSLIGLLYISIPLALLMDLRTYWNEEDYRHSMTVPLLIIFSIWINDTMAYIVGSMIGKTQLSPISPKKTWEGTIGGILLTIGVMALLAHLTGRLALHHAAIMGGIAAIAGTYGDLFESKLKRMAKVKDSGSIMPGHGGFLDRFDSLFFAIVGVWFYAVFFIK